MTELKQHFPDYKGDATMPFIFIIALFVYYVFGNPVMTFPDSWWHLNAGDQIRALGTIPATDSWTFTAGDARWFNIAWLYDIFVSWWHTHFGFAGLQFLKSLCAALTIAVVFHHMRLRNASLPAAGVIVFMLIFASMQINALRPQNLSYLIGVLFHLLLFLHLKGHLKALIPLPFLTLLWANMHGGVLIAFILIGPFAVEALVEKRYPEFKRLVICGIGCFIALFITPLGWQIFPAMYETLSSVMKPVIAEWRALPPFASQNVAVYMLVFFLVSNVRNPHARLSDKIMAFGWLLLALMSRRHFQPFTLFAAPYFALCLMQFTHPIDLHVERQIRNGRKILQACLMVLILLPISALGLKVFHDEEEHTMRASHLKEAAAYLQANHPDANLLHEYTYGGLLGYFSNGTYRIFVDGRADTLFPETVLQDYITIYFLKPGWWETFQAYDITAVVLDDTHPLSAKLALKPEWERTKTFLRPYVGQGGKLVQDKESQAFYLFVKKGA